MARVTTMPQLWRPLMDAPSVELDRCAVCGRAWPLNRHHVVPRSKGELWRDGRKVPKPTVTLCGSGNASGCHGLAHSGRLHFRCGGGALQFLLCPRPMRYEEALRVADGWRDAGWFE